VLVFALGTAREDTSQPAKTFPQPACLTTLAAGQVAFEVSSEINSGVVPADMVCGRTAVVQCRVSL
jgi:hypothetical protein